MSPGPAAALTVLFVKNPALSRDFYCALLEISPMVDEPGMVILAPWPGMELGLMAESAIRRLLPGIPDVPTGERAPRCELYFRFADLDAAWQRALGAGGRVLSAPAMRDWNEEAGYLLDPDGHLVACARMPARTDRPETGRMMP